MNHKSSTIRIRTPDKARLDKLCREQHRGITDMLAYLIEAELNRTATTQRPTRRKAV